MTPLNELFTVEVQRLSRNASAGCSCSPASAGGITFGIEALLSFVIWAYQAVGQTRLLRGLVYIAE